MPPNANPFLSQIEYSNYQQPSCRPLTMMWIQQHMNLTDEDDTTDTAESVKPFKIPQLTIQTRNRFFKLRHLPDDEDYGNWLESPVDMNQPIQEADAPRQAEDDVGVIQQNPVGNDVHNPTGVVVAWPDEE
ncbi:unnamed protein product [Lactuca virosa]|uniref:Uncharacterized protein n=1 Tax=Lactuca virosa TaxID=75947 RepID=A0AAU9MGN4_9ASTR|nr:unnamed protein product [Lactuca virosa]